MERMDLMAGWAGGNISPAPDPVEVRYCMNYSRSWAVLCCWENRQQIPLSQCGSISVWCFICFPEVLVFAALNPSSSKYYKKKKKKRHPIGLTYSKGWCSPPPPSLILSHSNCRDSEPDTESSNTNTVINVLLNQTTARLSVFKQGQFANAGRLSKLVYTI